MKQQREFMTQWSKCHALTIMVAMMFVVSTGQICQRAIAKERELQFGDLEVSFALLKEPEGDLSKFSQLPRGRLIVDEKSRGIKDVVMWLDVAGQPELRRIPVPRMVRMYEIKPAEDSWKPRFITAMVGDEVFYDESKSKRPHLITGINDVGSAAPRDRIYRYRLLDETRFPSRYYCSIERDLEGHVLTLPHRWAGVSQASGLMKLEAVPCGNWDFRLWHARTGWIDEFMINGVMVRLNRGRLKLEVKSNTVSRYEVLIPLAQFEISRK